MAKAKKKESLTPEERLQAALVPESEQPYPVPANWCWVYALAMFDIEYGKGLPTKKLCESGYPVFGANGQIGFYNEYMFEETKTLMSCRGAYSGTMNLSLPKSFITNNSLVIESKLPNVDTKFVFYLFSALNRTNLISGSAQPQVTIQAFNNYPVPILPLPEQQRIVDRIESLFAKLDEAKQKAQDTLDSFETRKAAILHKAFTGELTAQWRKEHGVRMESWENLRLENLIEGGPQNGLYKPQTAYGTGTKILRIDCFYEGAVLPWENLKRLALSKNEIEQYHLNINDIVINRVNSMAYLGKSALIRELPEECVFESNMMRIALNTRMVIPEYAIKYLNSVIGVQELRKNAKQAVNQASINQQDVKNVAIKLPKLDEQAEIVRLLDDLLAKEQQAKEAAEGVLEQIDLMKKAILARAFRGELGTNDPREESAVELLKQVL